MRADMKLVTGAAAALNALLLVALAGPAFAQTQTRAQQEASCRSDAFRFCEAEIPDSDKVEACLRKNRERISKSCQAILK